MGSSVRWVMGKGHVCDVGLKADGHVGKSRVSCRLKVKWIMWVKGQMGHVVRIQMGRVGQGCWINAATMSTALRGSVVTRNVNETARSVTTRRVLVVPGEPSLSAAVSRLDPPPVGQ